VSAFDLVEHFHLAYAACALHSTGVLSQLDRSRSAEDVAAANGLDTQLTTAVLQFLAERTELIERSGESYRATEQYDAWARAILDQYIGAYGPNAEALVEILRNPLLARGLVNRDRHAAALESLPGPGAAVLCDVLEQLQLDRVLDLGCGPAGFLVTMAMRNSRFVGWGLDISPAMCDAARSRVAAAGFADRLHIYEGDCAAIDNIVPEEIRVHIQALTAASVLNEFFVPDSGKAIEIIQCLRKCFFGKLLVVADYYGNLSQFGRSSSPFWALHDYIQAISGQGVPPADNLAWIPIYEQAGCTLLRAFDGPSGESFVHLVRLAPT
jgi:SAM-dependent methyltransferase